MSYFEGEYVPEQCHEDRWGYNHRFTVWMLSLSIGGAVGAG